MLRSREFVYTWWAGTVPDTFAVQSVFKVARIGADRRRRCACGRARGAPLGMARRRHRRGDR